MFLEPFQGLGLGLWKLLSFICYSELSLQAWQQDEG